MDAQVARPEDKELATLYKQFVLVRITDFRGVDMNRFQYDYDLTFCVLLMDANGGTYTRFGTREANSATDRLSITGLKNAMKATLSDKQRGALPKPPVGPPKLLSESPSYLASKTFKEPCAHCHYANNFRFRDAITAGNFTKQMLYQYPLPENVGISLEIDRNSVIEKVLPGSPAASAGLQPGDKIVKAGAVRVVTGADLQFALNAVPWEGEIGVTVERGGTPLAEKRLKLVAGWRKTDVSWRPSTEVVSPSVGIWCEPLTPDRKKALGLPLDRLALRVSFLFPEARWAPTRGALRLNDIIVDVDRRKLPTMTTRQFHAFFRMTYEVGQKVQMQVVRGGMQQDMEVPCLDTSH